MPDRKMKNSSFLSKSFSCPCFPLANTTSQAIPSTTTVRMAVPRLDSTPEIPTFARMEVRDAKIADNTAYTIHRLSVLLWKLVFFRSTIRKIPAARRAVLRSRSHSLWVSEKQIMAMRTVRMVLDLSIGATLFTSPRDSARK